MLHHGQGPNIATKHALNDEADWELVVLWCDESEGHDGDVSHDEKYFLHHKVEQIRDEAGRGHFKPKPGLGDEKPEHDCWEPCQTSQGVPTEKASQAVDGHKDPDRRREEKSRMGAQRTEGVFDFWLILTKESIAETIDPWRDGWSPTYAHP